MLYSLFNIAFWVYVVTQLFILVYCLNQANLARMARKYKEGTSPAPVRPIGMLPTVTVQLPVFNEMYVIERAIDSIAAFTYPRDRLQIQVLDDSNDETTSLIAARIARLRSGGLDITQIHRQDRAGFKAGALANGLTTATGEFVAVFDADFLPPPDFLQRAIPAFDAGDIGMVQTRWEHVNQHYSMLTRVQAFALDAHFNVEQKGRNAAGYFMNFNGTAGVWRKSCILDAGNWDGDTLTEDLDLSYRAQVRGWKFRYLEDIGTPAELPVTMNALKTQQFRWTKGAAECARKCLPAVLTSRKLSLATRFNAFSHLSNSTVFPCIMISALASIPLVIAKNMHAEYSTMLHFAAFSLLSLVALGLFYWSSATLRRKPSFIAFAAEFLTFLSFSMGFALHNSVAVFEGYSRKKMPFIRTPKFNINSNSDSWKGKKYLVRGVSLMTFAEGFLALYFASGIYFAVHYNDYGLLPFHLMLMTGFGLVAGYSFWHSRTG